jgi:hypothetical protein
MRHDHLIPVHDPNRSFGRRWYCLPFLGHHRGIVQPWLKVVPYFEHGANVSQTAAYGADAGENTGLPRESCVTFVTDASRRGTNAVKSVESRGSSNGTSDICGYANRSTMAAVQGPFPTGGTSRHEINVEGIQCAAPEVAGRFESLRSSE